MPTARWPTGPTAENTSTTLNGSITSSTTSVVVNDASKLTAPCYIVIDRVDASGNVQATSLWEYVLVTSISTNTLTVTRAQGGSTAQSHNNNAVVEAVVTAAAWEDQRTALQIEHDTGGKHVISLATITQINLTSNIVGRADISAASLTGLQRAIGFYVPGTVSAATIGVSGPIIMPFAGTWQAWTMAVQTQVSAASLTIQVIKNANVTVFDTIGRPNIISPGTFSSTASIKVTNFIPGDQFRLNIDTGGSYTNLVVEGISN